MRVWLIRHAASAALPGLAIGRGDPGLSDAGLVQAAGLASQLAHRTLAAVWSSDSRRAAETAAAIARPHRLAVQTTPDLREIDFGSWEGRFLGDVWSEDPAAARAWEADIRRTPPGFGESVADLEARVRRFWERLRPDPADELAVVGHRGSLAALRSRVSGQPFEVSFAFPLAVAGCECLEA